MEDIGTITTLERQKRNTSRISVYVDGQYLGSVDDIVWAKSGLKTGDRMPQALWEDMQGRQEEAAALDRALRRLSTRARGRAEMERYLVEKGFSAQAVNAVIDKLTVYGYLNDSEFARSVVRGRTGSKPVGRKSLAYELKRMGVGEEDAEEALGQYGEEEELAAALRQADKDFRRTAGETDLRKRRAKIYAGLARRGFTGDAIEAALANLFNDPSAE